MVNFPNERKTAQNLVCVHRRVYMVCRGCVYVRQTYTRLLIVMPSFSGVCICLAFNSKKKSHFVCSAFAHPSLCLRSSFALPPFPNRCKAVPKNGRKMGVA